MDPNAGTIRPVKLLPESEIFCSDLRSSKVENFKLPERLRWSRVIAMTESELGSQEIPGHELGQELGSGIEEGSHLEKILSSGSYRIPFLNSSKDRRSDPEVDRKSRERVEKRVNRVILKRRRVCVSNSFDLIRELEALAGM
jgi:hypothetical protein